MTTGRLLPFAFRRACAVLAIPASLAAIIGAILLDTAAPTGALVVASLLAAAIVLASAIVNRVRHTDGSSGGHDGAGELADIARPPARVSTPYSSLNAYLEHRYVSSVVLTFDQIESLLGFSLPAPASTEREWWTSPTGEIDGHTEAWTLTGRTATPNLFARTVAFNRPT
jgi:hypothetical protein